LEPVLLVFPNRLAKISVAKFVATQAFHGNIGSTAMPVEGVKGRYRYQINEQGILVNKTKLVENWSD
jgi:hypothetical protein